MPDQVHKLVSINNILLGGGGWNVCNETGKRLSTKNAGTMSLSQIHVFRISLSKMHVSQPVHGDDVPITTSTETFLSKPPGC